MATDWLRWGFVLVTAAVAIYHAVRLFVSASRRLPGEAVVDVTHATMAVAMTIMLVGRLGPRSSFAGAAVFGVALLWFVVWGVRRYIDSGLPYAWHDAGQAVLVAAMVFMLATTGAAPAADASSGMAGMHMSHSGTFGTAQLIGVLLIGGVGVAAVGFVRLGLHRRIEVGPVIAPTATAGCQVAMSVATVYMLGGMV